MYFGTGVSSCKDYEGLYQVIRACMENGIRHFDTAPSYGTEALLGSILKETAREFKMGRESYLIQTKIDPWQMQEGKIEWFVDNAMKKMDVDYLDSLFIHWPIPDYMDRTWEAFIRLHQKGIVKRIGVCNVRARHIEKMCRYKEPPQLVQIERNPLRTCIEEITLCIRYGMEIQAYSPLCKMDQRIRDSTIIKEIAARYSKSIGQVVLRWHLDTGAVPVFTTKKPERIKEYTDIFDFKLSQQEADAVSSLNENYKMYLESCICPGF